MREAYGRNVYGQSLLLARRLVEAGTRLACISWAPDANATWDTHGQNFARLKDQLLPPFDLGFSALLDDLAARGLLERTLVVAMGEIGRTPKINGNAGRDHWEHCYTVLFAGGAYDAELLAQRERLDAIVDALRDSPAVCRIVEPRDPQSPPQLEITVGAAAFEICRRLRLGEPPIYVGHGQLAAGQLLIHPLCLTLPQAQTLARRLAALMASTK